MDHENVAIAASSSPIRLIVGGKDKFVRLAKSHQVASSGRRICSPHASSIVRL